MAVAIVINERGAGAPARRIIREARFLRYVGESAIATVAKEGVLSVIGDEKIFEAVVVVIPDADGRRPADFLQARFFGDIGECAVAIIVIEAIRRALGCTGKTRAAEDENIHPAVDVVIEEGTAAAGGLENVVGVIGIAVDRWSGEAGFCGDIRELCIERPAGKCRARLW